MGENSAISWTDHTFNGWIGCEKVSAGCTNCYAERENNFRKWNGGVWGPNAERRVTSEANWRKPLLWNRQAEEWPLRCPSCGSRAKENATVCTICEVERLPNRPRVFTASLSDVFDDKAPEDAQVRLFDLIEDTPNLDWLVLTKRPHNALEFSRQRAFPRNVWMGTSVENQKAADERIPTLLQIPAAVRFLSCEPLLGPVRFMFPEPPLCIHDGFGWNARLSIAERSVLDHTPKILPKTHGDLHGIHWVIAGGESGPRARPSHPDWFRSLRDQCIAAGVAFHFKQVGEWASILDRDSDDPDWRADYVRFRKSPRHRYLNFDGGQGFHGERLHVMERIGKKTAGRELDGRTWDELPEATHG